MRKQLLSAFAVVLVLGAANAQSYYIIQDEGEVEGYNFQNTSGVTTVMAVPSDEQLSAAQTLPFSWEFFGQSVTQYLVSDNGYITFDLTATVSESNNTSVPDAGGPNNAIYALWDELDLQAGAGTPDQVRSWTYGAAPSRTHVIQWYSATQIASGTWVYATILIHEGGDFDIIHEYASGASTASFTVGCEDASGTEGVQVSGSPNYTYPATGSTGPEDDVVFHFISGTQPTIDPKLHSVAIPAFASPDGSREITGEVKNYGSAAITSYDITWTDGTDSYTHTFTAAIPSGGSHSFTHPDQVKVAAGSTANITVTVEVAGDEDLTNNSLDGESEGFIFVPSKAVVGEEATGTWCGWCPRGHVFMEYMEDTYGDEWIGIAVHNSDPMTITEYDNWMGGKIGGYPSGLVNRDAVEADPTEFEARFLEEIQDFGYANIQVMPLIDSDDKVTIKVRMHFATEMSANLRLVLMIVEDGLTGTTSSWNQTNYYSFQSQNIALSGAGHNWQTEPNPVPAADMVYNDVARELLNGVNGDDDMFTAAVSENDIIRHELEIAQWDADFNKDNSRIVAMLIDENTDKIINAAESGLLDYEEVVSGGETIYIIEGDTYELWDGDLVPLAVQDAPETEALVSVYPNPSNGVLNIQLNTTERAEILLADMTGKIVFNTTYTGTSTVNGVSGVQLNATDLGAGVYNLIVKTGETTAVSRVSIIK